MVTVNKELKAKHSRIYREKHRDRIKLARGKRYRESGWLEYNLYSVKSRAKRKGIYFDLSVDMFTYLPLYCPVLNIKLDYTRGTKGAPQPNSPSIDRIDNTKGYVISNVEIISHRANRFKSNATLDELYLFAKYILLLY